MPAIFTLTPNAVQQNLQNDGLNALGLTSLFLSPVWGTMAMANYSDSELTLDLPNGVLRAPFRGLLEGSFPPATAKLNANLPDSATSLLVEPGKGDLFPTFKNGSQLLTLSSLGSDKQEIVACTARTDDTLTIKRGMNGTAKQTFSSGDNVTLRLDRGKSSTQFSRTDGTPLKAPCAVFRLHPEAVQRLEQLMAVRYAAPARPVPWCMVVRNVEHYETDQYFDADDNLPFSGPATVSFHDGRGLIVDPIYVASLFEDLLGWLGALKPAAVMDTVNTQGGIHAIAQLGNATLLHVVDPHGSPYQPTGGQIRLIRADTNGNPNGNIAADGLIKLENVGDQLKADSGDAGRMRWGWAPGGLLARTPLTKPPGGALTQQFLRVCAVDINWFLLGNRTSGAVLSVPKDDGRIPPELLPDVRDQVNIDYLVDGPNTLAEASRVLQLNTPMAFVVSPQLDDTLITPNQRDAPAHWPNYPAPPPAPGGTIPNAIPQGGVTAAFVSPNYQVSNDVVVTLGNWVPNGAHVRIYPRQFQEILAIGPEPSFLRGDGGSNVATAAGAPVWLANPFALKPNSLRPSPPVLTMDIVITDRMGARRMFGNVSVNVASGPAQVPAAPFIGTNGAGGTSTLAAKFGAATTTEGIGPSPLFGVPIPPTPPPPAPPPGQSPLLTMILNLAAEGSPRQAPRLPMMARFETVVASGTAAAGAQPPNSLLWDAVVSGARWSGESLSAMHNLGNPGNPPGPDMHAAGVHATGALAYDGALAALHRIQPLYPWPTTAGTNPGWLMFTSGDNFDVPDDSANVNNTGIGALLRTIAVKCETSQLADVTPPPKNYTVSQMIQDAASALIGANVPKPNIPINNEARLQKELRREFFVAKHGLRDAQWSLLRAILQARELIYIESPQFAQTARPGNQPQDYEADLVAAIVGSLQSQPNLKVIVCTPRLSDFGTNYANFSRQHYRARGEAASMLLLAAPERVAIFHPTGFPGRPALVRTTSVVVDDVWSLVGATHFRRRGMTFDGSVAVASFDRQLEDGYSKKVRDYRRAAMAARLRVAVPTPNQAPTGEWVRLARPESTFALVADLLAEGGLGRIEPLWPGPSDPDHKIMAADDNMADPEGSVDDQFWTLFSGVLQELGDQD